MDTESNGSKAEAIRSNLSRLAEALLQYYDVSQPPTPIEQMLENPPPGLDGIDPERISSVMEHGMYSYAPRLAMARLLCREVAQNRKAKRLLGVTLPSVSYADVKFFARCLLMPSHWVQDLVEQGLSIEQISAYLQIPSYAVVTRLVELGLPIPSLK